MPYAITEKNNDIVFYCIGCGYSTTARVYPNGVLMFHYPTDLEAVLKHSDVCEFKRKFSSFYDSDCCME